MKQRELPLDECIDLLSKTRYGRLSLCQGDVPYTVPMSYVYVDGKIYLHSGPGGKKVEIAKSNPNICFEIDSLNRDKWSSVLVFGKTTLSGSVDAKKKMFQIFTDAGIGGHGGKVFTWEMLEKIPMTIWEIEVDSITGREGVW